MTRTSKSKLNVYTEVPLQLSPENALLKAKNIRAASKRKEAEKPMYLNRI